MHHHRAAWAYGDQLHLEPQYMWRYLLGCTVAGLWLAFALLVLTDKIFLRIPFADRTIRHAIVLLGSPLILLGAGSYLRGHYLCLDRAKGQILMAKGFLGMVYGWRPVAPFHRGGTLRFQYCQAELQSLCLLAYLAPGSDRWILLHIYTQPGVAHASAESVRAWEPSLTVVEENDQSAVPDARTRRPLVE